MCGLGPERRPIAAKFQNLFQGNARQKRKEKVVTLKEVRRQHCLDSMPPLPFVWDGRVGVEIRKAPTPTAHSWKPPRQRRLRAAQPSLPGHRAPVLGLPRGAGTRTSGKVGWHGPRPHFPPRVTGPSHAGRPPPCRGHQTVRTAPPGRLRARIPPPAPPPAGAPLGVTD